ncbi:MAG: methyltransferase domain-containing protein [Betaproteobacteria bacterium]|nr:methyltransferase domain-containing protein [Betaproteobacteria bacterium]
MSRSSEELLHHYEQSGLLARILAGLKALGKDLNSLTHEDLAPADEFHSHGRNATRALAEFARIPSGSRVLDVGSGLGGPARYLAATYGCDVSGIDLSPEFCSVANELSRLTGLAGRTRFQVGDALALPFADSHFDVVWTIQMQMNIADKRRLYDGIVRVLKPGGLFVCQEACLGNGEPLDFPVPWASRPDQSHLADPESLRGLVRDAGLRERSWRDFTAEIVAARKAQQAKAQASGAGGTSGFPPLGMHLVLGDQAAAKMANSARNTDVGRVVFIQGVFEKPEFRS